MIDAKDHIPEYGTDADLIRLLGVPEKIARHRIRFLDDKKPAGWPQKSKFWGNRRPLRKALAYAASMGDVK